MKRDKFTHHNPLFHTISVCGVALATTPLFFATPEHYPGFFPRQRSLRIRISVCSQSIKTSFSFSRYYIAEKMRIFLFHVHLDLFFVLLCYSLLGCFRNFAGVFKSCSFGYTVYVSRGHTYFFGDLSHTHTAI